MSGSLKIGVVLSSGQALGGQNVISGIFDYLQDRAKGSTRCGFKGGPAGIMKCKYVELNPEFIYPYRNQVAANKQTLKNVTDYITDIICKRAELGYNYGVRLIPEGLIDFIPEVQQLIAELNEILAHDVVDEEGLWKNKLQNQSRLLFDFLPQAIQEQLLFERDPHGNIQVTKIETEKMLISMVETELEKRKLEGTYAGHFKGLSHFFRFEVRCGLPTNFDSTYCYALSFGAGALHSRKTGLIPRLVTCVPLSKNGLLEGLP